MTASRDLLEQGLERLGLPRDEAKLEKLMAYLFALVKWNQAYNLTAIRDPEQMVIKHLLDSLSLAGIVQALNPATVLDVGTGPGLPGFVLALWQPERQFTLVDSAGKKIRFLRQIAAELGVNNVDCRHQRCEELSGRFDVITSRAFASLSDFVTLTAQAGDAETRWLAMKGQRPEDELAALPAEFTLETITPLAVPFLNDARHLVVLRRNEGR